MSFKRHVIYELQGCHLTAHEHHRHHIKKMGPNTQLASDTPEALASAEIVFILGTHLDVRSKTWLLLTEYRRPWSGQRDTMRQIGTGSQSGTHICGGPSAGRERKRST